MGLIVSGSVWAGDDEIAERIKKVGEVCVEGEDCGQASAATTTASAAGGASVEDNYNKSCATCHVAGVERSL